MDMIRMKAKLFKMMSEKISKKTIKYQLNVTNSFSTQLVNLSR